MKKLLIMLIISFAPASGLAQELKIVSFPELEKLLASDPEKPKLVNFWATWCKPCVEELPYFISAKEKNTLPDLQFIFVSVNFLSHTTKVNRGNGNMATNRYSKKDVHVKNHRKCI